MHELPSTERYPRRRSHPTARAAWSARLKGWAVSDGQWSTEGHATPGEAREEWAAWKGR